MIQTLLFTLLIISTTATAQSVCSKRKPAAKRTCIATVPTPTPTPAAKPCCDTAPTNVNVNTNTLSLRPVRTITRTKYKLVNRNIVANPNRLQLLVGVSRTKLDVEQRDCCNLKARTLFQPDVGLQYVRDFGGLSGSVVGTVHNSFYLGLGFNF